MKVHTAPIVQQVRELHSFGYNRHEIQRELIRQHGDNAPSWQTIKRWIDPSYDETVRAVSARMKAQRRAERTEFRMRGRTAAYQRAFIHRLHGEGVPARSIARVCRVVFGGRWTEYRVGQILKDAA